MSASSVQICPKKQSASPYLSAKTTMTQPTNTIPPEESDIQIPADVAKLLDEADMSGSYGAKFTTKSVQLVDIVTGAVVKEVFWHRAGEFGANLQKNILASLKVDSLGGAEVAK